MNDVIQIKCPFDGAVLTVRNRPGIETKSVTCPVCKNKYPFSQFKIVGGPSGKSPGINPNAFAAQNGAEGHTQLPDMNFTLGKLKVVASGEEFQLKPGRNVIGRKATKSQADFQIDTGENRSMSREHIVIEIKREPAKGFVHYVSLYKQQVNPTFIKGERLLYGDCIILSHKSEIKLPDATLTFEIPDDDATTL